MTMRTINLTRKSPMLHVEAPGCVVNIHPALTDTEGRSVVNVSVSADGNRYAGQAEWWIDGTRGDDGRGLRIIQTPQTYAPIPAPSDPLTPPECEQIASLLDELIERYGIGEGEGVWREVRRMRRVLRGVPASEIDEAEMEDAGA
jgi:hypothetical protein